MNFLKCLFIFFLPILLISLPGNSSVAQDQALSVKSPDSKTVVNVTVADGIVLSISHNGREILSVGAVSMELSPTKVLGLDPVVSRTVARSFKSTIKPVIPD